MYLDIINGKIGLFRLVDATEECNINLEFAPFPHFISDIVPGVPSVFMLVSTDDVMLVELQRDHPVGFVREGHFHVGVFVGHLEVLNSHCKVMVSVMSC